MTEQPFVGKGRRVKTEFLKTKYLSTPLLKETVLLSLIFFSLATPLSAQNFFIKPIPVDPSFSIEIPIEKGVLEDFTILNGSDSITLQSIALIPTNSYDNRLKSYVTDPKFITLGYLLPPKSLLPKIISYSRPKMWDNYFLKRSQEYDLFLYDTEGKRYYLSLTTPRGAKHGPLLIFQGYEGALKIRNQLPFPLVNYSLAPKDGFDPEKLTYSVQPLQGYFTKNQRSQSSPNDNIPGSVLSGEVSRPILFKFHALPEWKDSINEKGEIDLSIVVYDTEGDAYVGDYLDFRVDRANLPRRVALNLGFTKIDFERLKEKEDPAAEKEKEDPKESTDPKEKTDSKETGDTKEKTDSKEKTDPKETTDSKEITDPKETEKGNAP